MYCVMNDFDGVRWTFAACENYRFIVEKDINGVFQGKKVVKVTPDYDGFIYRLLKTKISANNGAEGLYAFMIDECGNGETRSAFCAKILNRVWDVMKEARQ